MQHFEPLHQGSWYHIYNRGINGENLFKEEENYNYFMKLYWKYMEPVIDTYAYCLLRNHFHLLVRVKEDFPTLQAPPGRQPPSGPADTDGVGVKPERKMNPSRQFGHLFNAYAQAINKKYDRTGGLFQTPFKRKLVDNDRYLAWLVWYIHGNAERHKMITDFRDWRYSSYHAIISTEHTLVKRDEVIGWFGNLDQFNRFHMAQHEGKGDLIIEEDE